uniref:Apple domain-containing protein n=1 Tax=Clytia hemisphaerica TaxID=252671 RepID=A0A7M5WY92_9CNID
MFIVRLFVFNLLYNEVLSQALSRYLRKQQATFSQNALTGQCLKKSLHEALTSVNNIAYDSLCAQHCLAHAQCLSVCYEMDTDICYLHDVDMKTLRREDFVYRYDCLYMDT